MAELEQSLVKYLEKRKTHTLNFTTMKTILSTLCLGMLLTFGACTINGSDGPIGPQGPQGPQGVSGEPGESGFVMEWNEIDFTGSNDYSVVLAFSDFDFKALESDVAIVFLKWGEDEVDGETVEIWRQIPQTLLTDKGILQYNYDFTIFDARLFMDANFDLNTLTADDTDNWIARVVVVPGDFLNAGGRKATSYTYEELEEKLGLPKLVSSKSGFSRRN